MKQLKVRLLASETERSTSRLPVAMLAAMLCLPAAALPGRVLASVEVPASAVGEVSMVLGKAWIQGPDSRRDRVAVGTVVNVSDRIETASNGHVHIRFIDDALVSVRPSSALAITRYEYNPAAPEASVVKLDLQEGVFRGISGAAAENARGNFRLNTPIAAIGVRGTDFVVNASRDSVRALVTEGAIIVAPFSDECLASGLGPCSQNGVELAGGAGQILQLSANALNAVLLPATPGVPQEELDGMTMLATNAGPEANKKEENADLYTDSVTARVVNRQLVASRPDAPGVSAVPEFTPQVAASEKALTTHQLVWGRWSEVNLANERITLQHDLASQGNRAGTIGNYTYGLFRAEDATQMVQPGLGIVAFGLDKAQASFTSNGVSELMKVSGGVLNIDFDQNLFSTSLRLQHSATGTIEYNAIGRVFAGGYFHNVRTETQSMAGAVSLDGSEAGYFFEKTLNQGAIEGLTLWGRQP